MKMFVALAFVFVSLLGNAQIYTTEKRLVQNKFEKNNAFKKFFDDAVKSNSYHLIVALIEEDPQAVIDEIEGNEQFSYQGFLEMPNTIKVEKALQMLEKNRLKGSIYKDLKKYLKKHIKKQKKNPAT